MSVKPRFILSLVALPLCLFMTGGIGAESNKVNGNQVVMVCCEGMTFPEKEDDSPNARSIPWHAEMTAAYAVYSAVGIRPPSLGECRIIRGKDTISVDMAHLAHPGADPLLQSGDIVWIEAGTSAAKQAPSKTVLVCGRGMTFPDADHKKTNEKRVLWNEHLTVLDAIEAAVGDDFNEYGSTRYRVEILRGKEIIRATVQRQRPSSSQEATDPLLQSEDVVLVTEKENMW